MRPMVGGATRLAAFAVVVLALWSPLCVQAQDDMYCGEHDCYDILGLSNTATQKQIRRAYRTLSLEWHPDKAAARGKSPDVAQARFIQISTAYDVLGDVDSRKDYDYYVEHPDDFIFNRYRYYRRRAAQVPWEPVVLVAITVISGALYFGQLNKHNEAVAYYQTQPKVLHQAKRMAAERALAEGLDLTGKGAKAGKGKRAGKGGGAGGGGGGSKLSPAERLAQLEKEAMAELVDNLDVRGGYRKPTYKDVFAVWLVLLPYRFAMYLWWHARWQYRFNWRKEAYGDEEKEYLAIRALGLDGEKWAAMEPAQRAEAIAGEVWASDDKLEAYRKLERERLRKSMGEKQYKRMVREKKHYKPDLGAGMED